MTGLTMSDLSEHKWPMAQISALFSSLLCRGKPPAEVGCGVVKVAGPSLDSNQAGKTRDYMMMWEGLGLSRYRYHNTVEG